jgi:hypothetical protein
LKLPFMHACGMQGVSANYDRVLERFGERGVFDLIASTGCIRWFRCA